MGYGRISQEELIEIMDGDDQAVIVKSAEPSVIPCDIGISVVAYIGMHSYVHVSEKSKKNFFDFNSIGLEKGPDGSVFIIVPEDETAQRIAKDLEKENPDELLCEIADRAALEKMIANNPSEELKPEVMSLD
ncbi:MAG: hypothetical protein KAJ29_04030 [Alphaproteobacteria bacterium]|nr:hypothetical protein [Alphaproteobacteria bacterium]